MSESLTERAARALLGLGREDPSIKQHYVHGRTTRLEIIWPDESRPPCMLIAPELLENMVERFNANPVVWPEIYAALERVRLNRVEGADLLCAAATIRAVEAEIRKLAEKETD